MLFEEILHLSNVKISCRLKTYVSAFIYIYIYIYIYGGEELSLRIFFNAYGFKQFHYQVKFYLFLLTKKKLEFIELIYNL